MLAFYSLLLFFFLFFFAFCKKKKKKKKKNAEPYTPQVSGITEYLPVVAGHRPPDQVFAPAHLDAGGALGPPAAACRESGQHAFRPSGIDNGLSIHLAHTRRATFSSSENAVVLGAAGTAESARASVRVQVLRCEGCREIRPIRVPLSTLAAMFRAGGPQLALLENALLLVAATPLVEN
jgi:hypothetical protein